MEECVAIQSSLLSRCIIYSSNNFIFIYRVLITLVTVPEANVSVLLPCLQAAVVATVSCSAQTTAASIIQKLEQMCGNPVSTNAGRVLRPKVSHRKLTTSSCQFIMHCCVLSLP